MHLLSSPVPVQPVRRFGTVFPASRQRSQRRWLARGAGAGGRPRPRPEAAALLPCRAAFASPEVYEFAEAEGFLYAIRIPKIRFFRKASAICSHAPLAVRRTICGAITPASAIGPIAGTRLAASSPRWGDPRRAVFPVSGSSSPTCRVTKTRSGVGRGHRRPGENDRKGVPEWREIWADSLPTEG